MSEHISQDAGRPTFLSRASLAERWDTSPGRLANLASMGAGPSFLKIGTRVLYALSVVEHYEAAHVTNPASA